MKIQGEEHDLYLWVTIGGMVRVGCKTHEKWKQTERDKKTGISTIELPRECADLASAHISELLKELVK